jgi:hypothetical protein
MASIRKDLVTAASPEAVWEAAADVGALHTRLVPGFVTATALDGAVRSVTFANGLTVREPIVTIDHAARRLVWTTEGGRTRHYNAVLEIFPATGGGSRLVWTVDLLPDEAAPAIEAAMSAGTAAMQAALDRLAGS